jgi:phage-related tail fiber protein
VPLVFTHFAVGDGDGSAITPDVDMEELVNERWRGSVNDVQIHSEAPSTIRIEGLIPANQGGWTIREAGVFNAAGELIVVASHPPVEKPVLADGVSAQAYIRVLIEYAAVDAVALSVDTDVVTATRTDVDDATAGGLFLWENFT